MPLHHSPKVPSHWTTLLTSTPTPTTRTQDQDQNTLSNLTSASKTRLLQHIASDITTALIQISKHLDTGTLSSRHTRPIEDMIGVITGTEQAHRRGLERRVRRMEAREKRRLKRWRGERRWMRKCFAGLLGKATEVSGRWRERVRYLRDGRRLSRF
ncbi:hypothetical protein P170DRAFT_473640 [Aspergillus steynii IBT 23096]|uniref:Uncharacterized protein n=1 Tax=Aspergillus steynii IBT 23096 TaxID=1392250 RepID=A0A2I2GB19_9EURO|nr:uncharacterized protein P170DRAFT_473640 [Aspergillus steynii IBT 23096]PLB50066.1 hypothetical protein P170DRAFT_473640 [Aspergillus steynii IBT 23096]